MMISHRSDAERHAPAAAGELPSPLRSAGPYAVILVAMPLMAAGDAIPRPWAAALAAASVLAGAASSLWSWLQRVTLCDQADRWIATGAGVPPPDAVVKHRREELSSARERRMLARSLRRLVAAAEAPPKVSVRVPTDRRSVTAEAALFERMAARLADVSAPVDVRAVARVHLLVTDAGSPLYRYRSTGGDDLHRRLTQIVFELERGV